MVPFLPHLKKKKPLQITQQSKNQQVWKLSHTPMQSFFGRSSFRSARWREENTVESGSQSSFENTDTMWCLYYVLLISLLNQSLSLPCTCICKRLNAIVGCLRCSILQIMLMSVPSHIFTHIFAKDLFWTILDSAHCEVVGGKSHSCKFHFH